MKPEDKKRLEITKSRAASTSTILVDQWTVHSLIDDRDFLLRLLDEEREKVVKALNREKDWWSNIEKQDCARAISRLAEYLDIKPEELQ